MKGLILAGGRGTRLAPMTNYINKHLLHVYDKPMFYYPLSLLLLLDIREIGIVCNPGDEEMFSQAMRDCSKGLSIEYFHQEVASGIPDAILSAKEFVGEEDCFICLGDNVIFGMDLITTIQTAISENAGQKLVGFSYPVADTNRFGIVERLNGEIKKIIEKPLSTKSNEALIGAYYFPKYSINSLSKLQPSKRGETEIVDVCNIFNLDNRLHVAKLGRGHFWMDVGTPAALHDASNFVQIMQKRQGMEIANLDEILAHK